MATYKIRHNGAWVYASGLPVRETSGQHVYSHTGSTQGEIGVDDTPTASSTNLVTSGGVASAISGTSQVFKAVYGTTTFAEIAAANTAGKFIYCTYENSDNFQLVTISNNLAYFSCISKAQNSDNTWPLFAYVTSSDVWSVDEVSVLPNPSGGSTGNVLKKTDSGVEWASVSAPTITTATFTLTAAGWSSSSQTVTVTGVTASNIVVVCPAPASCLEYDTDKILFTEQAANSVTFTCTTTPTVDINMNAMIIEA